MIERERGGGQPVTFAWKEFLKLANDDRERNLLADKAYIHTDPVVEYVEYMCSGGRKTVLFRQRN